VAAVVAPSGDALVGSWGGARAGLDAAVWTFAGTQWSRQDSAGTALESTADALAGPRGATADGAGLLVAGSSLHLGDGQVRQSAAVWTAPTVATGWHRLELPDAGQHSEAVSAACPPAGAACLVIGQVDGALAVWSLAGDRAARVGGIPLLSVGDQDPLPAPLGAGATTIVVSPGGAGTSVVTGPAPAASSGAPGGSAAASAWRVSAGPSGRPVAAALVGDRLYVATRPESGGPASLWSARWPG
jgi:hypothetical protein